MTTEGAATAVLPDWDQAGTTFECLNCGWMLDLNQPQLAGTPAPDGAVREVETDLYDHLRGYAAAVRDAPPHGDHAVH